MEKGRAFFFKKIEGFEKEKVQLLSRFSGFWTVGSLRAKK